VKKLYKLIFNRILHLDGFLVTDNFGDMDEAIKHGIDSNKTYEIMVHAKLSPDGTVVLDMNNIPLNLKITRLKNRNNLKLGNYKSLKISSLLLFVANVWEQFEHLPFANAY
jgi:hypothetical protein